MGWFRQFSQCQLGTPSLSSEEMFAGKAALEIVSGSVKEGKKDELAKS